MAGSGFTSQSVNIRSNGSGYIKAVYVDGSGNTTSYSREYTPDNQGGGSVTTRVTTTDEKGKTTGSATSTETFDVDGVRVAHNNQQSGQAPSPEAAQAVRVLVQAAESEASERIEPEESEQPGVDDRAVSNKNNCGWHPIVGCTKTSRKPGVRDMTASPVRGEHGGTGSGAARPRLGAEAVTNPGDTSYSANRSGRTGGGLIDMRDPSRGPDGGRTPATGRGFVPR